MENLQNEEVQTSETVQTTNGYSFSYKPLPASVAEIVKAGQEVPVNRLPVAGAGENVYAPVPVMLTVTNVRVGSRKGDDTPLLIISVKELNSPLFLTLKQVKNMLPDVVATGDSLATARRNVSYFCSTLRATISIHNEGAIAPHYEEKVTTTCSSEGVWLEELSGVFTREEKRELFLFQTEQEEKMQANATNVGIRL